MGAVKISPRALNKARSPLGLRPKDSMSLAAETLEGRMPSASVGTVMERWRDWPEEMS